MRCKLYSFIRKSCFLFCFVHVVLLISLAIMSKKFTSVGLSYKDVILFSKVFLRFRCSLGKIKQNFMRIFRSEHYGNAVKKAKGTLTLRKLKVDVLTVQIRGPRLSMLPFVRSLKLPTNGNVERHSHKDPFAAAQRCHVVKTRKFA